MIAIGGTLFVTIVCISFIFLLNKIIKKDGLRIFTYLTSIFTMSMVWNWIVSARTFPKLGLPQITFIGLAKISLMNIGWATIIFIGYFLITEIIGGVKKKKEDKKNE